jgi:hypothetical protein
MDSFAFFRQARTQCNELFQELAARTERVFAPALLRVPAAATPPAAGGDGR